jgi:hypothetical protein
MSVGSIWHPQSVITSDLAYSQSANIIRGLIVAFDDSVSK